MNKAKRDYEMSISQEVKTDPKLTWKYIKSKTKLRTGIPELYMDNNMKRLTKMIRRKQKHYQRFSVVYS